MSVEWPDSYDFRSDEICQSVFRPFIESELDRLRLYDGGRPADRTYIFHEHAQRVAQDVKNACLHLGLSERVGENMYWAVLPHDIGKRALPVDVWDTEEKPTEELKVIRRSHTEKGADIAREALQNDNHPFKGLMLDIMLNHHEQMDGRGYRGLKAEDLSKPVRLTAIVEAFDGWRVWRPHFGDRDLTIPGVLTRMREEKAQDMFDLPLFEAFADMKMNEYNNTHAKI